MDTEGIKRGRAGTDTADGSAAGAAGDRAAHEGNGADGDRQTDQLPRQSGTGNDGVVLAGRYRLGQLIGQGGMATVYQAQDESLGREVAIKLFHSNATDADELTRQQSEVRVLASLNHHNLVIIYDAGTDTSTLEPRTFLVMELVRGTDLHRLRGRNEREGQSRLGQDETATMGAGLADALAYIHDQGVIHRDVKPANILLGESDSRHRMTQPKLTDFGIARLVDSARLTATGQSMGTATYFSPEQAQGLSITPACDVYSLGLVLLECLTGQVAFPGPAVASAAARVNRDPEVPAALGRGWVELLTAMTAQDPAARPAADDVAEALRSGPAPGALGGAYAVDPSADTEATPAIATQSYPAAAGGAAAGYAADEASQGRYGPVTSPVRPASGHERVSNPEAPPRRVHQLDLADDDDQGPIDPVSPARKRRGRKGVAQPDRQGGVGEPSRRRRGSSPKKWALLLLAVAVVAAAVVVLLLTLGTDGGFGPVDYPSVPGELGQHLEDLQESVSP